MRRKITPLLGILITAAFGLAACGPVQAKEGQIYMADGEAIVTTVINMKRLDDCPVPADTLAFAERETYFGISNGSQGWDIIPLTEVAHTGPGCSSPSGLYDFIEGKPAEAGWTPIEDPEALKQAETRICGESGLRDSSSRLDEACEQWGMRR